jgi:ribosomal protein L9
MGRGHQSTLKKKIIDELQKYYNKPLSRKELHKKSIYELGMSLVNVRIAELSRLLNQIFIKPR